MAWETLAVQLHAQWTAAGTTQIHKAAETHFCHLERGHLSTAFLDDSLLLPESRLACAHNVLDTVRLFVPWDSLSTQKNQCWNPLTVFSTLGSS